MIKSRSILKFFAAQLILFIGVTKTYAIDLHVAVTNNSGLLHLAQALERSPIEGEENLAEIPRTNSDSGALSTRIDRLERELRAMTGQAEELQHKVQMLEEQLRVLRQEPPRTLDANSHPSEPQNNMNTGPSNTAQNTDIKAAKRSDAFNPSADSNAIGAPRPLGATSPSPPLNNDTKTAAPLTQRDVGQPMDLSHSGGNGAASSAPQENDKTKSAPASLSDPKDDYEAAVSTLQAGNFELAEKSFQNFWQKMAKQNMLLRQHSILERVFIYETAIERLLKNISTSQQNILNLVKRLTLYCALANHSSPLERKNKLVLLSMK